jgi:urea-proton symporter
MDTAFWQKSFASDVNSTVPAYDLASIVILAVPWCTGTIIGLSARAIENNPVWVLFPNTLTEKQVSSGMVMPYVLKSLLGRGATSGLLVLIFMAITSTVSSSMIAVSSIISLDFYRTYINPTASDKKTLQVSHIGVIFHGAFMAGFALMLNYAGATNNWSTYFRPIIACPGIFPMMLTILWSGQTKAAAIASPVLGLLSGLTTWFVLSWYWGGAINIQTTQQQLPGLYGAIVSFFSPALFSVAISLAKPSTFDWRIFLKLDLITEKSAQQSPAISATQSSTDVTASSDISENEKNTTQISSDHEKPSPSTALTTEPPAHDLDNVVHPMSPETLRHVRKWLRIASIFFVVNVVTTLILWPLPLYRDYIFTRSFFGGWVTVAIIWHFAAMGAVIVYPCFDGRHAIATSVKGVVGEIRALMGRGRVKA